MQDVSFTMTLRTRSSIAWFQAHPPHWRVTLAFLAGRSLSSPGTKGRLIASRRRPLGSLAHDGYQPYESQCNALLRHITLSPTSGKGLHQSHRGHEYTHLH